MKQTFKEFLAESYEDSWLEDSFKASIKRDAQMKLGHVKIFGKSYLPSDILQSSDSESFEDAKKMGMTPKKINTKGNVYIDKGKLIFGSPANKFFMIDLDVVLKNVDPRGYQIKLKEYIQARKTNETVSDVISVKDGTKKVNYTIEFKDDAFYLNVWLDNKDEAVTGVIRKDKRISVDVFLTKDPRKNILLVMNKDPNKMDFDDVAIDVSKMIKELV